MQQSINSTEQDYVQPSDDINIINQVKIHNNPFESTFGNLEKPKNISPSRKDTSNLTNARETNKNTFRLERKQSNHKSDFGQGKYPEYTLIYLLKYNYS